MATTTPLDLKDYKPTFHTTSAPYILPNDPTERQRLNEQHAAWTTLMSATSPTGTIFHAPVQQQNPGPRTVLDVGCGTGIASRALAARFPGARVRGIDLVAMPEQHADPPPNLEFLLGDCDEVIRGLNSSASAGGGGSGGGSGGVGGEGGSGGGGGEVGLADYIFSRLLVCGMADWPAHVRTLAGGLARGGWLELQEWDFAVAEEEQDGGGRKDVTSEWEWQAEMIRLAGGAGGAAAAAAGGETGKLDLRCAQKLSRWMEEEGGLVDVTVVRYRAPVGGWDVGARPQTGDMARYLERWWEPACKVLLGKVIKDEGRRKELEGKLERDLEAAWKGERRISYEIVVCWGRKP